MSLTLESFMETYLNPFSVDGKSLEDVGSIYDLYREKMKQTSSFEEMRFVIKQFKFFAWEADKELNQIISPKAFLRIKRYFDGKISALQYANLILPKVMLHAKFIANDCELPEYYAGVQFVAAQLQDISK